MQRRQATATATRRPAVAEPKTGRSARARPASRHLARGAVRVALRRHPRRRRGRHRLPGSPHVLRRVQRRRRRHLQGQAGRHAVVRPDRRARHRPDPGAVPASEIDRMHQRSGRGQPRRAPRRTCRASATARRPTTTTTTTTTTTAPPTIDRVRPWSRPRPHDRRPPKAHGARADPARRGDRGRRLHARQPRPDVVDPGEHRTVPRHHPRVCSSPRTSPRASWPRARTACCCRSPRS